MKTKNGFTLVELLVVVAIISILVAMLLPTISGAREKAKQMQCLSNLKQIGYTMRMYMDDYDGWFPPGRHPNPSGVGSTVDLLVPYAPTFGERYLLCPSRPDFNQGSSQGGITFEYVFNALVFDNQPNPGPKYKESSIWADASGLMVVMDEPRGWPWGLATYSDIVTTAGVEGIVHNGGYNFCFLDLHVKWIKFEEITSSLFNPNP